MAHIEIDDGLYERIAKIAEARGHPATPGQEIEKAVAVHLNTWEPFLWAWPEAAREANFPKGDMT